MARTRYPRTALLLAAATLIPIGVLSWLGLHVLQQDREVERQRQRKALEVAARRVAVDIERALQDVEASLARGEGVRLAPDGPVSTDRPLLYLPATPEAVRPSSSVFREGDAAEHRRRDLAAAGANYARIAEASRSDATVRAEALVRLGRVLRQSGRRDAAFRAYGELQTLGEVPVGGQPAALIARQVRCRMFAEAGDLERLGREAADFGRDLHAGGWPIDRATFEMYEAMLSEWGIPAAPPDAVARTEAAIAFWLVWRDEGRPPRGRRILRQTTQPMIAIWAGGPDRPVAWTSDLESLLQPLFATQPFRVSAHDVNGQRLLGPPQAGGTSLLPADSGLPFVISVGAAEELAGTLGSGARRELPEYFGGTFRVSPDGRHVAVTPRRTGGSPEAEQPFVLLPLSGGTAVELLRLPPTEALAVGVGTWTWSPDSRSLLVATTTGGRTSLWQIPIDGTARRKLTIDVEAWMAGSNAGVDRGFSVSPDGTQIAFLMGRNAAEVWALENFLPASGSGK